MDVLDQVMSRPEVWVRGSGPWLQSIVRLERGHVQPCKDHGVPSVKSELKVASTVLLNEN